MTTTQHTSHLIKHKDGVSNRIHLWISGENVHTIYLFLPAMGVRASYYKVCAEKMTELGVATAVVDWRGNGESSVRPGYHSDWGYKELIFDQYDNCKWLKKRIGFQRLYILGHSMGVQVGLLAASRYPDLIDGLVAIAGSDPYYKSWHKPFSTGMNISTYLVNPISKLIGHFPGYFFGFAKREAKTVIKDWAFAVKNGYFRPSDDLFDYINAKDEYSGKINFVALDNDNLAPLKAIEFTRSKFRSAADNKIYNLKNEQGKKHLNHFNWVKYPDRIFEIIRETMNEQ